MKTAKPTSIVAADLPIETSIIHVQNANGFSKLTSSRSISPLKIINPRTPNYCSAILSSYGGGFVEGDQINLDIHCKESTRFFLGTQAHNKVYRCPNNITSSQNISAKIDRDTLVAVLPDPLVLHKDSIFHQSQIWNLEEDSLFILLDWFSPGRIENNEAFLYKKYHSHIQVIRKGKPLLIENFISDPLKSNPKSAGKFEKYFSTFNLYIIGNHNEIKFKTLVSEFTQSIEPLLKKKTLSKAKEYYPKNNLLVSHSHPQKDILTLRGLGRSTNDFKPILNAIRKSLKNPLLLGHDPLSGKI